MRLQAAPTFVSVILSLSRLVLQGMVETLRGGSWNNNSNNVRSANRNRNNPHNRNNNIGFRVVFAHGIPVRWILEPPDTQLLRRPRLAQHGARAGATTSWPR